MKQIKKRIIYNNYDLWEDLKDYAIENLTDYGMNESEITEDDIWDEIYSINENDWDFEKENLEKFFNDGSTWILQGYTGKWNGRYTCGTIFDNFFNIYYKAVKDCDYISIYDENGHFYIKCSHHDGTNLYEIRKLTQKGIEYLDRWEWNYNDNRTEEHVHNMIIKKYSVLPHFAHNVYGCPKIEYENASA